MLGYALVVYFYITHSLKSQASVYNTPFVCSASINSVHQRGQPQARYDTKSGRYINTANASQFDPPKGVNVPHDQPGWTLFLCLQYYEAWLFIYCVFFSFFKLSNLQDAVAPREWPLFIEQLEHEALVFVTQHRQDDGRRRKSHWLNNPLRRSLLEALPWPIIQTLAKVFTRTVVAVTQTRLVW